MPDPAATTEQKKPLVSDDPFISQLVQDMGYVVKDGTLEAAKPAPEVGPSTEAPQTFTTLGEHAKDVAARKQDANQTPAEKPGETGDKKEDPKPDPKPEIKKEDPKPDPVPKREIEVQRIKPIEEIVEGAVRRAIEENRPKEEVTPKKEDPKVDPDAEYISSLDEDRKADLEVLQFGAQKDPAKYGKVVKDQLAYYRKLDAYQEERQKREDFDPNNTQDLVEFERANRPSLSRVEMRRLERDMVAAEATRTVEAKLKPEIDEATDMVRAQELRPAVEEAAKDFEASVYAKMAEAKDPALAQIVTSVKQKNFTDEAWKGAAADDKIAVDYARSYAAQAVTLGKEYLELATRVKKQAKYDPSLPANAKVNEDAKRQATLFAFIDRQERAVAASPSSLRIRDGKQFVTRQQFAALPPQQREKHWTIGHDDVLESLAIAAKEQAEIGYQQEIARLKEAGYERPTKKQETKKEERKEETPKPIESPKATVTPSPGPGSGAPKPTPPTVFTPEEAKKLWEGGEKRWRG